VIKTAILGANGYTGLELMRILASHPGVEVAGVASRSCAGRGVAEVFPSLRGFCDTLEFVGPDDIAALGADVVFTALPHGASQAVVPALLEAGARVVDLSADYRLRDAGLYREWYGEHASEPLIGEAVYGLAELYRPRIRDARLVANPGCYPTGAILALAPLMREGLIETGSVVVDSKSGVSGAGRSAGEEGSFVEVSGSCRAYKIGCHRHTPEIEQELGALAREAVKITFTPHLLPVSRGILTTAYARLKDAGAAAGLHALYSGAYAHEPFVRVMPQGSFPDISGVRGSNFCEIGLWADPDTGRVIVVSAIDNLVKGASGAAVQNMNVMCGIEETTALNTPPLKL